MKKIIVLMSFAFVAVLTSFQAKADTYLCPEIADLFEEALNSCRSYYNLEACEDCEFFGLLLSESCGGKATPEEIQDLCYGVW